MATHSDGAATAAAAPRRITLPLTPVEIDVVTEAEAVRHVVEASLRGEGGLLVTPNVDHLHKIAMGSWLGSVYAEADLVVADGMPLVWASRLMGTPLPERVAGSRLLVSLTEAAAANGLSVYFLGGTPGAAEVAVERFQELWPDLKVAGTSCPRRGFERVKGGLGGVLDDVAAAGPDIVFTALGAPKQEFVNVQLHARLPAAWCLGVGGAVDMAAGEVRPAPEWAGRSGTEWLVRLVQEPRRLGRRYLVHDIPFAVKLLSHAVREGRGAR